MSSTKNLDGLTTDLLSEIEESENQDDTIFNEFCSPFLAAEELAAHDYNVDVRPVKIMDKTKKPLSDTTNNPPKESNKLDTYLLTISW